jgi:NAD(P)H-nitrite reductase large subunit
MHVVILGNGIAGATAALEVRKRQKQWRITLISGESDFFYSRPALMYLYMGHMRLGDIHPYENRFWDDRRIERIRAWVEHIDTRERRLRLDRGQPIAYDLLLLATGSQPNKFGWPGQDLQRVQGLYSLQDVEGLERATPVIRHGVVVGGGLIGIELAEMLHSRGVHVTMLARESGYWNNALPDEEAAMVGRIVREQGIDLRLGTQLGEILEDGRGGAAGIVTRDGERIACQFVGLTAGVSPNVGVARAAGIPCQRGVVVDASLRTAVDGVFAAGDCAEVEGRVEQLWYTGKAQGEVAAAVMCGEPATYDRGIGFNSAKFLDLEWHTYGQVTPAMGKRPDGERHGWWQHPSGRHGLRVVTRDGVVVGMNGMGLRHRHRVWERWIGERRDAGYVLDHLREANFDPELSRRWEPQMRTALKEQLA